MTEFEATPDSSDAQLAPASSGNRIASLDLIRGFAVLGILAANIIAFGQPFGAYMWPEGFLSPTDDPDNWMWIGQFVLVDGKMRGLFTLLFGAGLALFMEKAWERGAGTLLQIRRLFWLLVFGLIHFFLIWRGDILVLYAVAGFIAVAFVRMKAKSLLLLGVLGYLIGGLVYGAMMSLPYFIADTALGEAPAFEGVRSSLVEAQAAAIADDASEAAFMTDGSYLDFVRHNLSVHLTDPIGNLVVFLFETLPLMLIGMGVYRAGLFNGQLARKKQLLWGWAGVIGGSALTLWLALALVGDGLTYWSTTAAFTGLSHYPRLPVVIGLAALLALWGSHAKGWWAERLSAAGRAAFSNYLGTSVLMMLVFHPWAGGLWGDLSRPELYLVVVFGWAVMLAWSKPWLERFRYGPLEWLWRCLTYGRMFPLRR